MRTHLSCECTMQHTVTGFDASAFCYRRQWHSHRQINVDAFSHSSSSSIPWLCAFIFKCVCTLRQKWAEMNDGTFQWHKIQIQEFWFTCSSHFHNFIRMIFRSFHATTSAAPLCLLYVAINRIVFIHSIFKILCTISIHSLCLFIQFNINTTHPPSYVNAAVCCWCFGSVESTL